MKEMIQARKEQLQERGVSGFTLMEMLIVVAIIAVLIAIAIPVFTTQLNAAKQAADDANGRSLYAALTTQYMTDKANLNAPASLTDAKSKSITYQGTQYSFSDVAKSVTIAADGNDGAPTVVVVSNDKTSTFGKAAA